MKIEFTGDNGEAKISYYRRSTILNYPCSSVDKCSPYKVTFPKGAYRIECWGASSDVASGGYTSGDIYFQKEETFYIHIGPSYGLYNAALPNAVTTSGHKGCGATDVRYSPNAYYEFESLKTRIMVAAGSGNYEHLAGTGMNAGGLVGEDASSYYGIAKGGNQTSGGITEYVFYKGSFGLAGSTTSTKDWGAIGGGGYYGGTSINSAGASAGGSSFISGYEGCDAIFENSTEDNIFHSHQPIHYSRFVFFKSNMFGGKDEMPQPTGCNKIGHTGHGVAKITPLFILDKQVTCINQRKRTLSYVFFIVSSLSI